MAILGKLSLRSDKHNIEKGNGAPKDAPPAFESAPAAHEQLPSYAANDPATGPGPEELNRAFSNLKISESPSSFPEPEHCLAHLKLLFVFHSLKEDVGYTDGLFGLWNSAYERAENKEETLAKLREKRWALYIARAVERFEIWWLEVLCTLEPTQRLEGKEMVSNNLRFIDFPKKGTVQQWTVGMLPPIGTYLVFVMPLLTNANQMSLWYGIRSC